MDKFGSRKMSSFQKWQSEYSKWRSKFKTATVSEVLVWKRCLESKHGYWNIQDGGQKLKVADQKKKTNKLAASFFKFTKNSSISTVLFVFRIFMFGNASSMPSEVVYIGSSRNSYIDVSKTATDFFPRNCFRYLSGN